MNNLNIIKIIVAVIIVGGVGLFAAANIRNNQLNNINSIAQSAQSNNTSPTVSPTDAIGINIGDKAPDFSFKTIEGQEVSLSSFKGQPVLFAFALTEGCAACIIEARAVREAQQQIPFKVIQLAISPYETVESLQYFQNAYGASDWLVGFDEDNKISNQYKVKAVDTTYIVDANGKIIYRDDGYPADVETIVNVLKKL